MVNLVSFDEKQALMKEFGKDMNVFNKKLNEMQAMKLSQMESLKKEEKVQTKEVQVPSVESIEDQPKTEKNKKVKKPKPKKGDPDYIAPNDKPYHITHSCTKSEFVNECLTAGYLLDETLYRKETLTKEDNRLIEEYEASVMFGQWDKILEQYHQFKDEKDEKGKPTTKALMITKLVAPKLKAIAKKGNIKEDTKDQITGAQILDLERQIFEFGGLSKEFVNKYFK